MNFFAILQLVVQVASGVKSVIDIATSNTDLIAKIKGVIGSPLVAWLEAEAAKLFPKAAPDIQLVGGLLAAFDPNTTKWLQGSLNIILANQPGFVPLVVDGVYGAKTVAAVEELQTKLGLKIDGVAGQLTQAAIQAILAKIPNITPKAPASFAGPNVGSPVPTGAQA